MGGGKGRRRMGGGGEGRRRERKGRDGRRRGGGASDTCGRFQESWEELELD